MKYFNSVILDRTKTTGCCTPHIRVRRRQYPPWYLAGTSEGLRRTASRRRQDGGSVAMAITCSARRPRMVCRSLLSSAARARHNKHNVTVGFRTDAKLQCVSWCHPCLISRSAAPLPLATVCVGMRRTASSAGDAVHARRVQLRRPPAKLALPISFV